MHGLKESTRVWLAGWLTVTIPKDTIAFVFPTTKNKNVNSSSLISMPQAHPLQKEEKGGATVKYSSNVILFQIS